MVNDYETYSDSDEDIGSSSSRETRDTKEEDAIMFADAVGGISDQIVLVILFLFWCNTHFTCFFFPVMGKNLDSLFLSIRFSLTNLQSLNLD